MLNYFLIKPSSFVWHPREPFKSPATANMLIHALKSNKYCGPHVCVTVSACKMRLHHSLYTFNIIMNNSLSCYRSEKQRTIRESRVLKQHILIAMHKKLYFGKLINILVIYVSKVLAVHYTYT